MLQLFAILVAMYIQQIISAFYSALRGGKLFAGGLFNILHEKAKKGVILCPGVVGPDFDPEKSILDEVIAWLVMFQGFAFQLTNNFAVPFPFNILLLPLTFLEWYLRVQVIAGGVSEGSSRRMMATDAMLFGAPFDGAPADEWGLWCAEHANCTCPVGPLVAEAW